jgi:hypothetical protein
MDYVIKTIPHDKQLYKTVGDYGVEKEDESGIPYSWVHVSDMKNETYELAVGIHELIEQHLCKIAGVKLKAINDYDMAYEEAREKHGTAPCMCPIQDEPGNDIHAPYHQQHLDATEIERMFINKASWARYDKTVESL